MHGASKCFSDTFDITSAISSSVPVPPEGSPLAEALARTEAEARAAEARLAQTATASENGGKA